MPTASPSIVARTGAVDETGASAATIVMALADSPTPSAAVTSGMPAAMRDPNVMARTRYATPIPMSSVQSTPDDELAANPDTATVSPAFASGSVAADTELTSVSGISVAATDSCTEMNAMSPFAEICDAAPSDAAVDPLAAIGYGQVTATTSSSAAMSSQAATTRSWLVETSSPDGAATTTFALAPLICGNRCSRASRADCAWVPGTVKLDWRWLPKAPASAEAPTTTASHTRMTVHRRRAAKRPTRYKNEDIATTPVQVVVERGARHPCPDPSASVAGRSCCRGIWLPRRRATGGGRAMRHSRMRAPTRSAATATPASFASVASAAVRVRSGARKRRAKVRLFVPSGMPVPR